MTIIKGEELNAILPKLKLVKQLNWENYYVDEQTGEKWIEEYPLSQMHGGGPPQLRLINKFPWE